MTVLSSNYIVTDGRIRVKGSGDDNVDRNADLWCMGHGLKQECFLLLVELNLTFSLCEGLLSVVVYCFININYSVLNIHLQWSLFLLG